MSETMSNPRRRLSKQARRTQLLGVAREIIQEEGTDALTLGRLAERADVAKPVAYDHFGDRSGLLAELYREFDARQHAMLDTALAGAADELHEVASIISTTYIECAVAEGREMTDVVAALTGSPVLEQLRQDMVGAYTRKCQHALAPYSPTKVLDVIDLRAVIGAAEVLARAVINNEARLVDAVATLVRMTTAIVASPQHGSARGPGA